MKTPPRIARPATIQELLRLFAAGNAIGRPERLRYLASPAYKTLSNGRLATVAGNGTAFIWTGRKVPGFRDYEIPPGGFGYVDLAGSMAKWSGSPQVALPGLNGHAGPRTLQELRLSQGRAVIRRADLELLQMLDTCLIGGGSEWWAPGWQNGACKWLVFAGAFGEYGVQGVVECFEPAPIKKRRKPAATPA